MNIEFLKAKDGEITARYDSLFLHSAYSPVKESQRFIENLNLTFTPEVIVFIEPALAYTLTLIKEKFPNVKTAVIRFSKEFDEYNKGFDKIIYASQNLDKDLSETFTEEELCSAFFVPWQPSEKAFPKESTQTWEQIKQVLQNAKTMLVTREYFEKKWFLNACNNISKITEYNTLQKTISMPVGIIASGPSLQAALPFLKQNQSKMYLICLSSAISCCLKNGITPDLTFSTDGGFWAGEHLKSLKKAKLPLVLGTEGLCPSSVLKNNSVVLLNYGDGLSAGLLNFAGIKGVKGLRNGTVSGTALDFALSYSNSDIYFFGLDLAGGKGYSHTNPNENENNNSLKDNRLKPLEKRITPGTFPNESLKIYEDWFKNKNLNGRKVFRVIQKNERQNTLGQIKDIDVSDFSAAVSKMDETNKSFDEYFAATSVNFDKSKLFTHIEKLLQQEETLKLLFPLDFVSLSHNTGNEQIIQNRINEKTSQILKKTGKLFK